LDVNAFSVLADTEQQSSLVQAECAVRLSWRRVLVPPPAFRA